MIEEVLPGLYRLEVPLPQNPLRAINSYIIKNGERYLIVDTGMNRAECREVVNSGLKKLGVDLGRADLLITHVHADHSGLAATLASPTSRVYASQADAEGINLPAKEWAKRMRYFSRIHGVPDDGEGAVQNHPGMRYRSQHRLDFSIINDGDKMEAGDYHFTCIITPGHSLEHVCLYEPEKKLFISGDHILEDITPNISSFNAINPLRAYLDSLDKVYGLEVEMVLPGHRRLFNSFRKRIAEIKQHHQVRLGEVISILENGTQNAYEVATQMTWDLDYDCWDDFPPTQKWIATGEALAHLKYLEYKGEVRQGAVGSVTVFSRKN